ncbi:MAG: 6-bladed beta-propeller, partial [Tannerella sp.]|nr:6-bladed beta-propeller [Tannerella sp.]
MKKQYMTLSGMLACCLLACQGEKQPEAIPEIEIGRAMDAAGAFGISEMADGLSFVALETTDSSLIGSFPDVAAWGDKIIVSSQNQPLLVFDRKDGRFRNSIGYLGDGPEACAKDAVGNVSFCIDPANGTVYLRALGNRSLLRYGLDGRFLGRVTPDMGTPESVLLNYYFLLVANDTATVHNKAVFPGNPYMVHFSGRDGHFLDTVPSIVSPAPPGSEIASIGVMILEPSTFGATGTMQLEYKDGKALHIVPGSPSLWSCGGERYLKEAFIDTVYTVGRNSLTPRLALNAGKWRWPYEKKFDREGSGSRIAIDYMLENEHTLYFHFHTGLHGGQEQRQAYCGFYDKRSGNTKVMEGDRIEDDLYHFLPLTVSRVSASGEFLGLIQAA